LLFLVVVLPSMLLMLFIEPVFKLWLGSSYDLQVASAARVLIAGVALNSMAQFNFMLLQLHHGEAAGAHLQLVNLLISVVLMATLIPPFGTMGAAAAFSIRLAIDAFATRYLAQLKSNSSDGFSYKELATTLLVLVALLLL
jgi:O-antigen/teichoic acid export membrane protein